MTIELGHVTAHDVFLAGVIVGLLLGSWGRRRQGERLGKVEKIAAVLLQLLPADKAGAAHELAELIGGRPKGQP